MTPKNCRMSFGGQLVRKMKKASTSLITGGNRSRVPVRKSQVPNSTSAAANLGSGGGGPNDIIDGNDRTPDSCSSGGNDSCGNDSLGSGQHSPSPPMIGDMLRSESVGELKQRKGSMSSHNGEIMISTPNSLRFSQKNPAFNRRSNITALTSHYEDSDGNNADDDSINSFSVSKRIITHGDYILALVSFS